MTKKGALRTFVVLTLLFLNVACDQVSKHIVRLNINYHERIELAGNYFTMTKIENSGAFLSFGDSFSKPVKAIFLNILPLLVLAYGLFYVLLKQNIPAYTIIGLGFAIGGGVGNLYDRIIFGSVTDFLHIDLGIVQTGIFNLADVSIMVGMGFLLLESFGKKAKL